MVGTPTTKMTVVYKTNLRIEALIAGSLRCRKSCSDRCALINRDLNLT